MATSVEPRVARARANAVGWGQEPSATPRRRRGRVVAGVISMLVFGWIAIGVFLSVGSRKEVVAVAHPVEQFQKLTSEDLRVVRVAADRDVAVVPADDLDELVGRVASTDLAEGALLHENQLLADDERLVGQDESKVGAVLSSKDSPADLESGAAVDVILRSAAGSTDTPTTMRGWVAAVDEADLPGAEGQRVSLVVPSDAAPEVSAAAAEDRLSLAVAGRS